MDPNQSASTSASSQQNSPSTPGAEAQDIQQPVNQYQEPAATAPDTPSTADTSQPTGEQPKSTNGKNWLEYAGLQKVVDQLPQGVRDLVPNSVEQFNKLSTTQKIAGAVALAGLGYLALRSGKSSDTPSGKYASKRQGSYTGASGSYGSATETSPYGQSYGASSLANDSRTGQGPGWGNNHDATQSHEARSGSYNAPSARGTDADFGSGV
ncbi:hypothetical protein ACFPAF_19770 [Hymenobacter endophyticus]|uniref:DUF3300 domain-containing protein n=1 Tax=Hymenobacter endophyticus TaxID=3076335 RepID=A0ABU3TMQ9_9BACT|nr:hypothetical protein [Hymenobacter endophyticus]MDU0372650.1 hypothetical protein [Hymenobacter endophyticus]